MRTGATVVVQRHHFVITSGRTPLENLDSVRLYQSIVCRRTRKLHARQHRLWPATELSSSPTDAEWSVAVGLVNEKGSTPEARDGKIKNEFPWGKQWPPSKRRRKLFGNVQKTPQRNAARRKS